MKPLFILTCLLSYLICDKQQIQATYPEIWAKLEKMVSPYSFATETVTLSIFLEKKGLIAYTERSKKDVDDGQNQNSIKEFSQLF
jgi:hypothetical protein